MSPVVRPVPSGSTVLHIGPHKTGTTALQEAMRRGREDLLSQGVRLAGRGPGDGDGVRLAVGMTPMRSMAEAERAWETIKADLGDVSVPRRILSRETLANAGDKRARRVVEELRGAGATRLQVVVSARPLAELIPSQYSQFVQRGTTDMPFEKWCEAVLAGDTGERSVRVFWKRHSHDEQVRRWGEIVGFENVTIVVVDKSEPLFLVRAFEQLLDLRPGTLAERMGHDRHNRSLTVPELELVRQWHEVTREAAVDRKKVARLSWKLCQHLRRFDPDPSAARLRLPDDAVARADERGEAIAKALAGSGTCVVGDLSALHHR